MTQNSSRLVGAYNIVHVELQDWMLLHLLLPSIVQSELCALRLQ